MIAQGRTMQQAVDEGTFYAIQIPGWADLYYPPAAESVEEVISCAHGLRYFRGFTSDPLMGVQKVLAYRIVGLNPFMLQTMGAYETGKSNPPRQFEEF